MQAPANSKASARMPQRVSWCSLEFMAHFRFVYDGFATVKPCMVTEVWVTNRQRVTCTTYMHT